MLSEGTELVRTLWKYRKKKLGNFIDVGLLNLTRASFTWFTNRLNFSECYMRNKLIPLPKCRATFPLKTALLQTLKVKNKRGYIFCKNIKTDSLRISIFVTNLIHEFYSR